MNIIKRTINTMLRRRTVGCGLQGGTYLALSMKSARSKWQIEWAQTGTLGDADSAKRLSAKVRKTPFWTHPSESGGLKLTTSRSIEIPPGIRGKQLLEQLLSTQVSSRFLDKEIVIGGVAVSGTDAKGKKTTHYVGGGAIREHVDEDYGNWYRIMGIRRPHLTSSTLALANAYLALYPKEKRAEKPLRMIVLRGRSVDQVILMDDWRYLDELELPRMEGVPGNILGLIRVWEDDFRKNCASEVGDREIIPLVVDVGDDQVEGLEYWNLWDETAVARIKMDGQTAEVLIANRDLAPIAFGMAIAGGE